MGRNVTTAWMSLLAGALIWVTAAGAKERADFMTTPLAAAFGAAPAMWGARLSPSGTRVSLLAMHPEGPTIAMVLDVAAGRSTVIMTGETDRFSIRWCDWANEERLLCGLEAIVLEAGIVYPITRLVAVNVDGSDQRVLMAGRLRDIFSQFQDNVIDWLPEDSDHVLIEVPGDDGTGVGELDVYDGTLHTEERDRTNTRSWITDGYGIARLRHIVGTFEEVWRIREEADEDAPWRDLAVSRLDDLSSAFAPIGFSSNRNELLYLDRKDDRMALFAMDLADDRRTRLVFSHPEVDVDSVYTLGKHRRVVAASYVTDRPHLEFFDSDLEVIHSRLARLFPGKLVAVTDEDWDKRHYLVFVGSDRDSGTYYRLDTEKNELVSLSAAYPSLQDAELNPMTAMDYAAADGTPIPAYLTLPAGPDGARPTVILPHGGPSSRDYWAYDFLVQYLAASGYAVLQSNYRGSDGYGASWLGAGGFQNWRVAVGDITDGLHDLVDKGIADADRVCAVGWSYGGYAALLSVLEHPDKYKCVVSIAGVTDPIALGHNKRRYIGGRAAQSFIGFGDEVGEAGSPMARVDEMAVPVLLVHGRRDVNVPFEQSDDLARALSRADKDVELIEYEFADHNIEPERYRIDLLARIGAFLEAQLAGP